MLLDFVLKTLKPFLAGVSIKFDRQKRLVIITQKGSTRTLTFDEAIDEIEKLFDGTT